MYSIGISYGSMIQNTKNLHHTSGWDVSVLEIPLSIDTKNIRKMTASHIPCFSLHIPSFELIDQFAFVRDFQNDRQVLLYLEQVKVLLEENIGAEYLVAHYPLKSTSRDMDLMIRLNRLYIDKLNQFCSDLHIRLFIENVAVNCVYYRPEIYLNTLDKSDGICFDIGHAHSMDMVLFDKKTKNDYVEQFFNLYKEQIKCIHLYNCTNSRSTPYSFGIHYPFGLVQSGFGFMNERYIRDRIASLPCIEYVIHEIHRDVFDFEHSYDFGEFGSYYV